jgi:AcrR family transcriptional regulator
MNTTTTTPKASTRDRIIATACDLFYRQGYRATGINQIIAESGVAKASFYDHFPSKEDLLYVYACKTSEREMNDVRTEVMALPTARERFFGAFMILSPWFQATDFRGCPFQLLMAETPPDAHSVMEVGKRHREAMRAFVRELAQALSAEDPKLRDMDCDALADTYLILFEGTMAVSVAYQDDWPIKRALETLEVCLERFRR